MKNVFVLATVALGAASQAVVVIGNMPPVNDGTQTAGVTTIRYKAVSFTMGATAYNLSNIVVRLGFVGTANLGSTPTVQLRADGGADPGAVIESMTSSGYAVGNGDYTFTPGSAVTLAANTTYWIAVVNGVNTPTFDWKASTTSNTPTGVGATHGVGRFTTNGTTFSASTIINTYQINGEPVPEPATILGIAAGLGILARRRRK